MANGANSSMAFANFQPWRPAYALKIGLHAEVKHFLRPPGFILNGDISHGEGNRHSRDRQPGCSFT